MACLVGFGGGRDHAIRLLEECAVYASDVQTEARLALVLIYNREKRYNDACRVLTVLRGPRFGLGGRDRLLDRAALYGNNCRFQTSVRVDSRRIAGLKSCATSATVRRHVSDSSAAGKRQSGATCWQADEADRPMAKKTSWGLIILGISAFVLIVGVGLVAVMGYVIYQQFAFQATSATEFSAEQEFTRVVAEFEGQKPYLVVKNGEPVVSDEKGPATGRPVEALHIIVWKPDEQKVVRLNVPFWLLRMTKGRPIRLSSNPDPDGEPMRLRITAEDLERRGPGLILDYKEASGQRVLVWAQ